MNKVFNDMIKQAIDKMENIKNVILYLNKINNKIGHKLDSSYIPLVTDSPEEKLFDKKLNKLDSITLLEELYNKNGNVLDRFFINSMSNKPI